MGLDIAISTAIARVLVVGFDLTPSLKTPHDGRLVPVFPSKVVSPTTIKFLKQRRAVRSTRTSSPLISYRANVAQHQYTVFFQ